MQSLASRFTPARLRTSLRRRNSSTSSSASSAYSPSTASTINSVIFRQPSIVGLEEERRTFANELAVLEPRPIVYWGGVEERMGSL